MDENRQDFVLGVVLVVYLLIVGIGAAVVLIINFPTQESGVTAFPYTEGTNPRFVPFGNLGSIEQGLILIAMLAGVAGSFLHAAQSLASYLGNADFKASWTAWYFLRPWIGGILGYRRRSSWDLVRSSGCSAVRRCKGLLTASASARH